MESLKTKFCNIRLTEEELIELDRLMKLAGITNRTKFIKSAIFDKPLKVVYVDKNTVKFYNILINLQAQYKAVGHNFNQAVKALHTAFSNKKALAFIFILRDSTLELKRISEEIFLITEEFNKRWLQN